MRVVFCAMLTCLAQSKDTKKNHRLCRWVSLYEIEGVNALYILAF